MIFLLPWSKTTYQMHLNIANYNFYCVRVRDEFPYLRTYTLVQTYRDTGNIVRAFQLIFEI